MQAFNKFAGVSEADSKPLPPPPPIPTDETPAETLSRRASRASLPRDLYRSPSRKSLRSGVTSPRKSDEIIPPLPDTPLTPAFQSARQSTRPDGPDTEAVVPRKSHESAASNADDFTWGPTHPCFPHLNPHCLPESDEYSNTRVIRVRRDWLVSGDLYPQFQNLYPEILDPMVSDSDFRFFVTNLNGRLEKMYNPWGARAWIDAALGLVTGFIYDDAGLPATKRGIKDMERFIDDWNDKKAEAKQDIRLIQPRRTGFLSLDFVIADPGFDNMDRRDPAAGTPVAS